MPTEVDSSTPNSTGLHILWTASNPPRHVSSASPAPSPSHVTVTQSIPVQSTSAPAPISTTPTPSTNGPPNMSSTPVQAPGNRFQSGARNGGGNFGKYGANVGMRNGGYNKNNAGGYSRSSSDNLRSSYDRRLMVRLMR
ncbi:hypothetical protein LWI29_007234 [Acer saccharum]|uniref:Uncharacterized protein n=1 Tax=Acer saccharum TaxID=4024 RepID=A0AA39VYW6_ACESA|nr:hypothetical protein LWI29_007234 [Acer saccharum]